MAARPTTTRWLISYDAEDDVLVLHPRSAERPGKLDLVVLSGGGVARGTAIWRTHGTRKPLLCLSIPEA